MQFAKQVLVLASRPEEITRALDAVVARLESHGFASKEIFGVRLALEEALVNALTHGNQGDASKKITLTHEVSPTSVALEITDEGLGFARHAVPDCRADDRVDQPHGRGLLLIHTYMTRVEFNAAGNQLRMSWTRGEI